MSRATARQFVSAMYLRHVIVAASVLLIIGTVGRINAEDKPSAGWPQFLGPTRNGISTETKLIDTFDAKGPAVLWRAKVGGGMSGVAVDDKLAVTMTEQDGKQQVVAIDLAGKPLWSTPIADGYQNTQGDGPRATPTIAARSIFAYSGNGVLVALDSATGKPRWQHNVLVDLGGQVAEYGMACSPLVYDNLVVVTAGAKAGAVVAYDVDSGKLVWKTGDETPGYSSPALLTVAGQRQVVALCGKSALGIDPTHGTLLWRYEWKTDYDCNTATPIVLDDHVFISSGENHGCAMLALKQQDGHFSVSEVWKSLGPGSVMRNEWQTCIAQGELLFGLDNVGSAGSITNLNCVNAKTGVRVWQKTRFGKSNLIFADGKLYITTMKGELVIVRATAEKFEELARAQLFDTTRQAPALANGKLYIRAENEILCVDLRAVK